MSVLSIGSGRGAGRKSARSPAGKRWEATFKTSLETMLDPFAIITPVRDLDGHITDFEYAYANTAMAENVHVDCEALTGRRLLDVRQAHRSSGLFEMYRHVLEADEPLVLDDFAYSQELMGGEERHYDIRAAHIPGDGLTYTWRDVTERQSRRQVGEQLRMDRERLDELERFQRLTVGRELKMIELKKEIENLKKHGSAGGSDLHYRFELD